MRWYSREILRKLARLLGYDVVRIGVNSDPLLTVKNLVRDQPEPVLFDVGANVGQTARRLVQSFPSGKICCFEPTPAAFQSLKQETASDSQVKLFPMALGAESGKKLFRINQNSVTNSFLSTASSDSAVSRGHSWYEQQDEVEVEVRRLDEFCQEQKISHIDLLKIDVQGFEMQVLEGAGELLNPASIRLVMLEALFVPFYEGQCHFDEISGFLRLRGYKLVDFYEKDVHPEQGLLQANALFKSVGV